LKVILIDQEPRQTFKIPFEGDFITVTLEFRVDKWVMGVEYKGKVRNGMKLATNSIIFEGANYPFDFTVVSKHGLDPFALDSFNDEFQLVLLERADMEFLRGYEVE